MKQLLTKFRGDEIWAPCGHLQTGNDVALFGHTGMENTEEPGGVHADDVDEPLPNEQSKFGRATVEDGDSPPEVSGLEEQGGRAGFSPRSFTRAPAATDEMRLREETEGLRSKEQSVDPVQAAVSALVDGGVDEGINRPQDTILQDAGNSAEPQVEVVNGELPAAEQSIVMGDISGDDVMGGISNAEKVILEDRDAPTTTPAVSESGKLLIHKAPMEIAGIKLSAEEASLDIRANGNGDSTGPELRTVDMEDSNLQAEQPHEQSGEDSKRIAEQPPVITVPKHPDGPQTAGGEREEEEEILQPAQHRMTTRAQAQAASDNVTTALTRSPSPASSIGTFVHPFFLVPHSAHPDRDFGLPPAEAEDTRRVLMSYVQKQEEVCRGVGKLYEGLLRADRLRKTVLQWCKAEEHVGEMSDGEDWYDKEEWALDEDLKKGHDEEEDEGGNQGKKTRGRRA